MPGRRALTTVSAHRSSRSNANSKASRGCLHGSDITRVGAGWGSRSPATMTRAPLTWNRLPTRRAWSGPITMIRSAVRTLSGEISCERKRERSNPRSALTSSENLGTTRFGPMNPADETVTPGRARCSAAWRYGLLQMLPWQTTSIFWQRFIWESLLTAAEWRRRCSKRSGKVTAP